ncbi:MULTISPECIES: EAL domain-containing protein [Acidiphilium]|uniref:EAL domain, c-di-GMP-specific phosphodiesterase class I (Or its enzymatically inactive variant) n=1 Tax=Acidiphilium rubrum TaxID=526 RepID=A0A8G2CKC1_ACIRU|nr:MULTISPECIES: sensor domain-containing phosphodiesterase [Acidiphilium]MBW4034529.1 sensor domain-containing phosphodiesterase [Pseudomonadota bacterium]SIQ72352.1 EAL domain, c-di-GMP-specific phosphodiesterase class I (or its enzymatically inactive variant) [Acidiphilium rubrum]
MSDHATYPHAMRAERNRYVALAFCWGEVLFELDRHFAISYVSNTCQAVLGCGSEALIGQDFRNVVAPSDRPMIEPWLQRLPQAGRAMIETVRLSCPGAPPLWVSLAANCLDSEIGTIHIAVQRRDTAQIMARTAGLDPATGLADCRNFVDRVAERMQRGHAAGRAPELTLVAMPDLHGLQERLGSGRDGMLQAVGEALKASSIGGDMAARISDDKFSLLHQAGAPIDELMRQLEAITRAADPAGIGLAIDASTLAVDTGVVAETDLALALMHTLRRFGEASGPDFRAMAGNLRSVFQNSVRTVGSIQRAISDQTFRVAFQPIVHVKTGHIHHFEALCRFEGQGEDSPFKTIQVAEELGLIAAFDLVMVRKVIDWLLTRPLNNARERIAVNVSGYSIEQPAYTVALLDLLAENDWLRGRLMFEITESARIANLETADRFIQALRQRGFHVSLDDFGAGAASFQYLSVLDVDVVKLDGSAVRNAQKAQKGRAFLSALTELCRRMGIETIAEMVDTADTLQFVRDCGCNYVQGYLFGKPAWEISEFHPLPNRTLFSRTGG